MEPATILIVATLFLVYSFVSERLENTSLTPPMIFAGCGILLAIFDERFFGSLDMSRGRVHIVAELTLIFVLFTDASRIDLKALISDHNLPQRLLAIGLPLTILLGALVAYMMFDEFLFWEAALLAAILAPTDAALGHAVVTSENVPFRIRQTLSVESGLNDGIALPAVLLLASLASSTTSGQTASFWTQFVAKQLILGPAVGLAIGYLGAKLIEYFSNKKWLSHTFEGIGALSIALIAFAGAEVIGGNGFIAAFLAGLAFGNYLRLQCRFLHEFAESEGQFFTLTTFLIFGTIAYSLTKVEFQWSHLVYAGLSLTLIRMIPVAISLIGSGVTKYYTPLFLGWFGPRGLASILFALLIIDESEMAIANTGAITSIVVITVLLSIALHGITAAPFSKRYGEIIRKTHESDKNETQPEFKPDPPQA